MTEQKMLQLAERCRRLGRACLTAAVARKFEALAADYEEYARVHRRHSLAFAMPESTETESSNADLPVETATAPR